MSKEDNENYNEEEYHFAVDPDDMDKTESSDFEQITENKNKKFDFKNFNFKNVDLKNLVDIKKIQAFLKENIPVRNALIAVGVLILLIIVYQFTSGLISKKKDSQASQTAMQNTQNFEADSFKLPAMQAQDLSMPTASTLQEELDLKTKNMNDNLAKLRIGENEINAKIASLSSENFKLATEYQQLSEKVNKLAMQVEKLVSAVEDQSQSIMSLSIRRENHPRRMHSQPVVRPHFIKYFVKALIPGRAWLIAENGSTLTVRTGSIIPGYGVVTMVDVSQGRVLTNSGKVITFGQNDS